VSRYLFDFRTELEWDDWPLETGDDLHVEASCDLDGQDIKLHYVTLGFSNALDSLDERSISWLHKKAETEAKENIDDIIKDAQ